MFIRLINIDNNNFRSYVDFDDFTGLLNIGRHTATYLARYSYGENIRPVVVKIPKKNLSANIDRLKNQSKIVSRAGILPQVISFIPLRNTDGTPNGALITEYRRGISLSNFIENRLEPKFEDPFVEVRTLHNKYLINPEQVICFITKGIVSAIKELHQKGYSHEELTTDNVLITDGGDICLTSTGKSTSNGDFQDDIYRIGVIMYQLCVRQSYVTVLDLKDIESLSIRNIVFNAIKGRYGTAYEMLEDLENIDLSTTRERSKFSLFSNNRKLTFNISTEEYGAYRNFNESFQLSLDTNDSNTGNETTLFPEETINIEEEERKRLEEEARQARILAEQEKARKQADEEERKRREVEARQARILAEQEKARKQAEEEDRKRREEEARQARILAEQEKARKQAEEVERKRREEEARQARILAEQEKAMKQAEEVERKRHEEEARKALLRKKQESVKDKNNSQKAIHNRVDTSGKIKKPHGLSKKIIYFTILLFAFVILMLFLMVKGCQKNNDIVKKPEPVIQKAPQVDSAPIEDVKQVVEEEAVVPEEPNNTSENETTKKVTVPEKKVQKKKELQVKKQVVTPTEKVRETPKQDESGYKPMGM